MAVGANSRRRTWEDFEWNECIIRWVWYIREPQLPSRTARWKSQHWTNIGRTILDQYWPRYPQSILVQYWRTILNIRLPILVQYWIWVWLPILGQYSSANISRILPFLLLSIYRETSVQKLLLRKHYFCLATY